MVGNRSSLVIVEVQTSAMVGVSLQPRALKSGFISLARIHEPRATTC